MTVQHTITLPALWWLPQVPDTKVVVHTSPDLGLGLDQYRLLGGALDAGSRTRPLVAVTANRADCSGMDLRDRKFRASGFEGANFTGADLSRTSFAQGSLGYARFDNALLRGANFDEADVRYASFIGADITEAYFDRARGMLSAYFEGAHMRGDVLECCFAEVSRARDAYIFRAFALKDGRVKVMAGCRWFSVNEYRQHILRAYPGDEEPWGYGGEVSKRDETRAILDYIEARAKTLGYSTEG